MENNQPVYYDIEKLCKGGLTLVLPAYDSSAIDRRINIKHDAKKVRVPRAYALGIFVDPTLERMYKDGYFKVLPEAAFEKEVAAIFYPVENKVVVAEDKVILEYLMKGNRVKIKELIEKEVNRSKIVLLARENIDSIPSGMVKDLENILGVELTID